MGKVILNNRQNVWVQGDKPRGGGGMKDKSDQLKQQVAILLGSAWVLMPIERCVRQLSGKECKKWEKQVSTKGLTLEDFLQREFDEKVEM